MQIEQNEFEHWFLSLNRDFTNSDLSKLKNGSYFLTTTNVLFKQYKEINRLRKEVRKNQGKSMSILINNKGSSATVLVEKIDEFKRINLPEIDHRMLEKPKQLLTKSIWQGADILQHGSIDVTFQHWIKA